MLNRIACTAGVAQPSCVDFAMGVGADPPADHYVSRAKKQIFRWAVDAALGSASRAVARCTAGRLTAAEHPDESSRRDERWRRLVCCCRPLVDAGHTEWSKCTWRYRPRPARFAPARGAVVQRGCAAEDAPRRRCARNPVLCLGFRSSRGRDPATVRRRMPRGKAPEPLRVRCNRIQVLLCPPGLALGSIRWPPATTPGVSRVGGCASTGTRINLVASTPRAHCAAAFATPRSGDRRRRSGESVPGAGRPRRGLAVAGLAGLTTTSASPASGNTKAFLGERIGVRRGVVVTTRMVWCWLP